MDEGEYLEQRLQDQIDWYDRKSRGAQRWFTRLRAFEIVAAAAIPLLVGYNDASGYARLGTGVLGLLVAITAGLLSLYRLQENWVEYRTTCETLKQEKFLFLARVEPYDAEGRFPLLVRRVEGILSGETGAWSQRARLQNQPAAEEKKAGRAQESS